MNVSAHYRLIAWLRRGHRRKEILAHLSQQEKALTPSDIKKALNLHLVKVSASLRELKQRGLIKILNPKDRYSRLYQITKKGEKINKPPKETQISIYHHAQHTNNIPTKATPPDTNQQRITHQENVNTINNEEK